MDRQTDGRMDKTLIAPPYGRGHNSDVDNATLERIFDDAGRIFAAEALGFVLVERGNLAAGRQFTVVVSDLHSSWLRRSQQRHGGRQHLITCICTIITINSISYYAPPPAAMWALRDSAVRLFVCSFVCRLKRVLVGHWGSDWPSSVIVLAAVSGRQHYYAAGSVRPVSDKYAFQATYWWRWGLIASVILAAMT